MGNSLTIKILFTMKAFAAAGIIAAASAASIKATPTPSFEGASLFDASKYYSYGLGTYEYPEFDHKEELTPVIEHPQKPNHTKPITLTFSNIPSLMTDITTTDMLTTALVTPTLT